MRFMLTVRLMVKGSRVTCVLCGGRILGVKRTTRLPNICSRCGPHGMIGRLSTTRRR